MGPKARASRLKVHPENKLTAGRETGGQFATAVAAAGVEPATLRVRTRC
jgi:hypothetical protein